MPRKLRLPPPDGIERAAAAEEEIVATVGGLLDGPAGQAVMRYLRSITIEQVGGPSISNDHLRHLEGQRYVVGILEARIKQYRTQRTS